MTAPDWPADAAAVLIWLFAGDNADADDFDWAWVESPPDDNPRGFWTLRDALVHANSADCAHGKGAWIKVGDRILDPVEVEDAYRALGL